MTVQAHREAQRLKPLGLDGLKAIERIVETKAAAKVNEVFVDLWSASCIAQVARALNETNRTKLLTMPVGRVAEICFKLFK